MSGKRVLFVLTGHDRLGSADDASADRTGFHLTEAAHPWCVLRDAAIDADLVTPNGGQAPIDPSSKDLEDSLNRRFLDNTTVQETLASSPALESISLADYAGIYFPGGHGTMWDLPEHPAVISAVRAFFDAGKPIAAVCHGPAALVNVRRPDGHWLVDGKSVAVFSDDEEQATGKDTLMPFSLASTLAARGASLKLAHNFAPSIAIDGNLITGQNPASADGVAAALRQALT